MDFEIRTIIEANVDGALALVRETLAEFGLEFGVGSETDDQVRNLPASYVSHGGQFFVALDGGGTVVGTAGVFPVAEDAHELRKMYLRPQARGQGVGKQLFEACVAFSRAHGARRLVLDTRENMSAAIAFYESHGFVRDDAQKRGARCTRGYRLELG
jgi:putative acetyltransferase